MARPADIKFLFKMHRYVHLFAFKAIIIHESFMQMQLMMELLTNLKQKVRDC